MKINKGYIKQIIREELDLMSDEYLVENETLEEGISDTLKSAVLSAAVATSAIAGSPSEAEAKPVTIIFKVGEVKNKVVFEEAPDANDEMEQQDLYQRMASELESRLNLAQSKKKAGDREPISILGVREATPGEQDVLPSFSTNQSKAPAVVKKSADNVQKTGENEYTVTGVKDANSATQAVIDFVLRRDGQLNKRLVPQKVTDGTYKVTLSAPLKENNLTKSRLKQIIKETIEEGLGGSGEYWEDDEFEEEEPLDDEDVPSAPMPPRKPAGEWKPSRDPVEDYVNNLTPENRAELISKISGLGAGNDDAKNKILLTLPMFRDKVQKYMK